MSVNLTCCCGGTADCFFGVDANDGATACNHTLTEELIYKKARPAFNYDLSLQEYSEPRGCDCAGSYVVGRSCPASSDVVVKYSHFQNNDTDRIWTWHYDNWSDVWPVCDDPCCGFGSDDAQCCDGSVLSLCSDDFYNASGGYASKYQRSVIANGYATKENALPAIDCQYGDQYKFLQGVSDRSTDEYYKHWGVTGGTVAYAGLQKLSATIIAVFHREHWYKRYSNSLTATDAEGGSSTDRAAAACSSGKWFLFGCSGCWLSSWECKEHSSLDSVYGAGTADSLLVKVNAGEPVPEAWLDTLEDDGILGPIKDWEEGGKLIKKELTYYNNLGVDPTTVTDYFFARPGGWDYVCEDFVATDEQAALNADWPQIPRRFSVTCDTGGESNCHTAAPFPVNDCTECVTTNLGDPASIGCNPCGTGTDPMGNCDPPVLNSCGLDTDAACTGDVLLGTCRGLWVQSWSYALTKGNASYSKNYQCDSIDSSGDPWNGYICRVANEGDTCTWTELPDEMTHLLPGRISGSMRDGTSDTDHLCCGAEGQLWVDPVNCPASSPTGDDCDEPPSWGPGL